MSEQDTTVLVHVDDLSTIGHKTKNRLKNHGITTFSDFVSYTQQYKGVWWEPISQIGEIRAEQIEKEFHQIAWSNSCSAHTSTEHPGIETIGAGGGPRDDSLIPCHRCGIEEQFSTIKRSDGWTLTYLDDGSGQWVAYCPECDSQ